VGGLIGAGLTLAGVGALLLAGALPSQSAQLVQASQPINPGATEATDIATHNSPALAHDPTDPATQVVANRIDGPEAGCALYVSTDHGATWSPADPPKPDGEPACFAPDVSFGPEGTLYVAYVTLDGLRNEPAAAWLATSPDGGQTWNQPRQVTDGRAFQVSVTADPTQPRRVYMGWLEATAKPGPWGFTQPGNPIKVARSDDAGQSWTQPATITPQAHQRPLAPNVATAGDGDVAVAYLDLGGDTLDYQGGHEGQGGPVYDGHWTLALAHSTNNGESWNQTTVTDELVPAERLIAFFPPTPAVALGQHDRVHVAFHDARESPADVWHWTSPDDGASFTEATRVNDTPDDDTSSQYLPQLAVASTGRVDVVYYDRRGDPDNVFNHVSLQASHDDGATFGPRVPLTDEAFDSRIGDGAERNLATLGSQLGLTATPSRTGAVWADTRAAPQGSAKQDLATAAVVYTTAPTWRPVLFIAGLLATLAGLALTTRWTLSRRRTSTPRAAGRTNRQPARR
jgi:hypothetical protein